MSDLAPVANNAPAPVEAAADHTRYGVVVAQLHEAGRSVIALAEVVRQTFDAVKDVSRAVDMLAELAVSLDVDADTVTEHKEAASIMRSAHQRAEALSSASQEMAGQFRRAASAHEDDYGRIAERVQAMPVHMAHRSFYASR